MPASEQGLKILAGHIKTSRAVLANDEKNWEDEAQSCEHCIGRGGDGLECRYPNAGDGDPFCYSDRCPLIK